MREFVRPFLVLIILVALGVFTGSRAFAAGSTDPSALTPPSAPIAPSRSDGATIPLGTVITTGNWRPHPQFMPDGMITLFEGRSAWKMPDDVAMTVGPTVINPLPATYLAATAKFSPT